MRCKKCGAEMKTISNNVIKTKHRGLIGWLFWFMLAICTCGLILIIPLLTNTKVKGKTVNYWYCPKFMAQRARREFDPRRIIKS